MSAKSVRYLVEPRGQVRWDPEEADGDIFPSIHRHSREGGNDGE